ncbi:hypothetical protein COT62_03545 [Candidatus Roizmanbacteria bacterium CG09_land_8_20_14_0_10_41_9]|uniref:Uncharacterized protein n=1 Tax=Candidatus Roizmanbacteria bacterium CG09_land_8_20_14_0_10_41_9 TaxID=1974850 RepID=A0A2H0WS31_9BACT|nr:MAG: hypothetical protein COT62_03545 [Candidatus Roizmanbacteria bacterium CG09_land_8_20_14_0_10_41_9]
MNLPETETGIDIDIIHKVATTPIPPASDQPGRFDYFNGVNGVKEALRPASALYKEVLIALGVSPADAERQVAKWDKLGNKAQRKVLVTADAMIQGFLEGTIPSVKPSPPIDQSE